MHFAPNAETPFSFTYGGHPSAKFLRSWNYSVQRHPSSLKNVVSMTCTYKNPEKTLRVDCDVKVYQDWQAVMWTLRFTNTGKHHSQLIADVKTTDLSLAKRDKGAFTIHYANGCNADPDDFAPRQAILSTGQNLTVSPEGGRSSQGSFPFFNVDTGQGQGVITAIGWTGTWKADFSVDTRGRMSLITGIRHLNTWLNPGESIRSSSICLLFWKGSTYVDGQNKWRQFVLNCLTPRIDGQPVRYPFSTSFNYGDPYPCNEYSCLDADYAIALVERYKQFDLVPEVFWLDAGWYTNSGNVKEGRNWYNTVGNWTVDADRFPDGLKPVSDAVHQAGAKFMVWFEPERVFKGSQWSRELKREWLIDGGKNTESYLFNLCDTSAVTWLSNYINKFMDDNGIDDYRQDFNIEPTGFWAFHDGPGREGITENHYIEGLYSFWDRILKHHPHGFIDNCAGGGRRLDLETIQRSAPLWRTDYKYGEPVGYQSHTFGLEFWLPQTGTGVMGYDKFSSRSSLGTSVIYDWKVTEPDADLTEMRKLMDEYDELRPYYYQDYYPLTSTSQTLGNSIWMAYELNRPAKKDGIIVAFRRENAPDSTCIVKLKGLEPNQTYTVTDKDSHQSLTMTGKQLSEGITLTSGQPRSSLILKYTSKPEENILKLSVSEPNHQKVIAMGTEFDPHFLSQNVTRSEGCKIEDWNNIICRRVKDMQIQRFRVMVLPSWYEPKNDDNDAHHINWDAFRWNSKEMKSLYAELDLAQHLGIQVNLTLWGAEQNHFLAGSNYGDWVLAPLDDDEWAENFSALIQYLLKVKHYTCIKEITPVNEPDWAFIYNGKKSVPSAYIKMCKVLDSRFRHDGIRDLVKFSLSDNSDGGTGTHKYLQACTHELANVADIFNSHTYIFGYQTPNSEIYHWEWENCQLSNRSGKPHFIGEYGGNQCVGSSRQRDINLYKRGVLMARIAINCMNAGAAGLSYWSLMDLYYNQKSDYNGMQQLGLWKTIRKAYEGDSIYKNIKVDYEPRPQFYAYSLLTRFIRSGAEVYPIKTDDEFYAGMALKNPDGHWTYIFANSNCSSRHIQIANRFDSRGIYNVYRYVRQELPLDDRQLQAQHQSLKLQSAIDYNLPLESIVVFDQKISKDNRK
jgi:alpha-galactosidase